MWRMRIIYLIAGTSLVTFLLAGLFWFRSGLGDHVGWRKSSREVTVLSYGGVVMIAWGILEAPSTAADGFTASFWPFERRSHSITVPGGLWRDSWGGFYHARVYRKTPTVLFDHREVRLPWYFLTLLPVVAFSLTLRPIILDQRMRRRHRFGLCLSCGYDLRASNGRCPECGKPFSRPSETGVETTDDAAHHPM